MQMGMYMALTGATITGLEAYWSGMAKHIIRSEDIERYFLPLAGTRISPWIGKNVVEGDKKYQEEISDLPKKMLVEVFEGYSPVVSVFLLLVARLPCVSGHNGAWISWKKSLEIERIQERLMRSSSLK